MPWYKHKDLNIFLCIEPCHHPSRILEWSSGTFELCFQGSAIHSIKEEGVCVCVSVRACTEYWSGLPFPTPGNLSEPGMKPISPALAGRFFTTAPLAESKGRRNTHCIPSVSCTRAGWFLCAVSSILKRSMLSVIGVLILTSERWRHGLHGQAGSPNFSSFSK